MGRECWGKSIQGLLEGALEEKDEWGVLEEKH